MPRSASSPPIGHIGLIGPDRTQPCGIADYTALLAAALGEKCDLVFTPFRDALTDPRLADCRAILVQYERSLVPDAAFLGRLSARFPGRVHVAPHEVYDRDPFAFPYEDLRAAFPPLLWLKRLRYRWRHRAYAAEKRLQAAGYRAHRVIPLSGPGAEILRALAGDKVLDPVPLGFSPEPATFPAADARADGPAEEGATVAPGKFFPIAPKAVLGIFGFLNPGLDYASVLDALVGLDAGICLLILGSQRGDGPEAAALIAEAEARGLRDRVLITGFLPEAALLTHLRRCAIFLCPMRFKSNSGSLMHLFPLGKTILASDIPLTRYLKDQGAPLDLYQGAGELKNQVEAALSGALRPRPNRYPWDFGTVADAYLRILGAAE